MSEHLQRTGATMTGKALDNRGEFINELCNLINSHSIENESQTPDFVLASYLMKCLEAFESATKWRDQLSGITKNALTEVDDAEEVGDAVVPT